ncbi:DUF742 domain-containing protein [Streptomyces sp. NPDC020965]|uniref:DUF742 domain-containing protein n=1 Tax=Streptomyces sp. NPDC020965 TaxID=3365105 RepID=UPI003793C949
MNAPQPRRGRRSRPWSATGGRILDLEGGQIRLDTQVQTDPGHAHGAPPAGTRYARILQLCRTPQVVTQIAGELELPLGVTAALVAELRDRHLVTTAEPMDLTRDSVVTNALLLRVRDRLNAAL